MAGKPEHPQGGELFGSVSETLPIVRSAVSRTSRGELAGSQKAKLQSASATRRYAPETRTPVFGYYVHRLPNRREDSDRATIGIQRGNAPPLRPPEGFQHPGLALVPLDKHQSQRRGAEPGYREAGEQKPRRCRRRGRVRRIVRGMLERVSKIVLGVPAVLISALKSGLRGARESRSLIFETRSSQFFSRFASAIGRGKNPSLVWPCGRTSAPPQTRLMGTRVQPGLP